MLKSPDGTTSYTVYQPWRRRRSIYLECIQFMQPKLTLYLIWTCVHPRPPLHLPPSANIDVCSVLVNAQKLTEAWKLKTAAAPVVHFLLLARRRAADCCSAEGLQGAGNEQSFWLCVFYPITAAAAYPVTLYSFSGPVTLPGCNSIDSGRFWGCYSTKIKIYICIW